MTKFQQLPRWFLWSLFLPLMILNGWVALKLFEYFRSFFTIAIAATLLSFILSYPVKGLQRFRLPKAGAVGIVLLLGIAIVSIAALTLLPPLFEQISQLSAHLSNWMADSTNNVAGLQAWAAKRKLPIDIAMIITQLEGYLASQAQFLSGSAISLLPEAIANVLDIFLILVLTIYLLLHGDDLWQGLFRYLPVSASRRLQPALMQSFHNYFVSQGAIALMMGLAMTFAFLIIQVPFGLLFGLVVGVMTLVPFGAGLGIVIISGVTALKSVWLGLRVLAVAAVIDQVIEQAIAPSLIGNFIGLNPVWILVSLLLGAKILGFLGLILAVPIASTLKMLLAQPNSPQPPQPPQSPQQSLPALSSDA